MPDNLFISCQNGTLVSKLVRLKDVEWIKFEHSSNNILTIVNVLGSSYFTLSAQRKVSYRENMRFGFDSFWKGQQSGTVVNETCLPLDRKVVSSNLAFCHWNETSLDCCTLGRTLADSLLFSALILYLDCISLNERHISSLNHYLTNYFDERLRLSWPTQITDGFK